MALPELPYVAPSPSSPSRSAPPGGSAEAKRILVVSAESVTRSRLRMLLLRAGYQVELAASGEDAEDRLALAAPDAVLLDPSLPDRPGVEFCRQLREWNDLPIIVVSASSGEPQIVAALDFGADDVVPKPIGHEELLARLRAVLRRARREETPPVLVSGGLRLDRARRRVTLDGRVVHLTPTEYAILCYLMTQAGKTITYGTLLRAIWGDAYGDATASLRVFVAQLRRKIEPDPDRPTLIQTVPRVGYRLAAPVEPL